MIANTSTSQLTESERLADNTPVSRFFYAPSHILSFYSLPQCRWL
jgi:hypothetical protein